MARSRLYQRRLSQPSSYYSHFSALFGIRFYRDLQEAHSFAPLQTQNLTKNVSNVFVMLFENMAFFLLSNSSLFEPILKEISQIFWKRKGEFEART